MEDHRKSSRRAFLRGQAAVEAIQDVAENLVGNDVANLPPPQSAGYLLRICRRAMACDFEVLLNAKQYPHGTETAMAALDLVDHLEAQLTVYRDDSEVSRLNQLAHEKLIEIEPRLFGLLQRAAEIHRETGGAYDITSGPLSKIWGFYRREGRVPSNVEIQQALEQVGMQHVEFDAARQSLQFNQQGVELNLGSIGKGYALDRVAELLQEAGIEDFLLHGGNSSVLARGTSAANPNGAAGWWVGVRHPLRPDKRLGQIRLRDKALGTSGSGTQFFIHEGQRLGHILDPRTGRPADEMLSSTVAASTGADADALATALYVLGPDAAIEYCRRHQEISAIVISPAANATQANITIWNLAADELQLDADPSLIISRESATTATAHAPIVP